MPLITSVREFTCFTLFLMTNFYSSTLGGDLKATLMNLIIHSSELKKEGEQ
jgi:hypothetical protein